MQLTTTNDAHWYVRRCLIESSATISYALSTIGITEMDTRDGYNISSYESMCCCYAAVG
jgi:hypothetical protein